MDAEIVAAVEGAVAERSAEALRRIYGEHSGEFLADPWDVVQKIIGGMRDGTEPDFLNGCIEVAGDVLRKCDPTSGVFILHKELTECEDVELFSNLLEFLGCFVLKLPEKRFEYKSWCFSAIQGFIGENLPAPRDFDLGETERMLADADPDVYKITEICSKIFDLYDSVLCAENLHKLSVINYMINLLGKPLIYLDVTVVKNTKGRGRLLVEKLAKSITSLIDPFVFLNYKKSRNNNEDHILLNNLALAHLFYLILVEKICWDSVPKIYAPLFQLQSGLHFAAELLKNDHQFITEKGLLFSEKLLELSKGSTPYDSSLLDDVSHCAFATILTEVITYSTSKRLRQRALAILKTYITNFDTRGRYLLIYNIFNITSHQSLLGYLITLYKDFLVEELDKPSPNESLSSIRGNSLPSEGLSNIQGNSSPNEVMLSIHENTSPNEVKLNIQENSSPNEVMSSIHENSSQNEVMSNIHDNSSPNEVMSSIHENSSPNEIISNIQENSSLNDVVSSIHDNSSSNEVMSSIHENSSPNKVMSSVQKNSPSNNIISSIRGNTSASEGSSNHFTSPKKISAFIRMFCSLPRKEESDILDLSEQIIPSLNLLRYLIIRDQQNRTGIKELISILEVEYLEPIKKGLAISKAHYELKIKEVEEEGAKGDKKEDGSEVTVRIKGADLPDMSAREKLVVLRSSMTAFDVVESLLCRLFEFIELYKNKN